MKVQYNSDLKERAKQLRKQSTLAEILLWQRIKNKQLGFSFDRQQVVGNYIVDFLCRKENAVIEIDGESHDGKVDYDKKRDKYLKEQGLAVIHIHDLEVKTNMEGVLEFIKKSIKSKISTEIVTR